MAKKIKTKDKPLYKTRDCHNGEKSVYKIEYNNDQDESENETRIGIISQIQFGDDSGKFFIKNIEGYEINNYPKIIYPDENSAVRGLYAIHVHFSDIRNQNSTNDKVISFLFEEIRNLEIEKRNLDSLNYSFDSKVRNLRYFVELFNLKNMEKYSYILREDDYIQNIKELESESGEKMFSESYLYEKLGKEDARSVFCSIDKLIKKVDKTKSIY